MEDIVLLLAVTGITTLICVWLGSNFFTGLKIGVIASIAIIPIKNMIIKAFSGGGSLWSMFTNWFQSSSDARTMSFTETIKESVSGVATDIADAISAPKEGGKTRSQIKDEDNASSVFRPE